MKKVLLPILMLLCFFGFQKAEAQIDLTLNPIGALFGDFNIGADFALARTFSLEAQVGIGNNKIGGVKGANIPINLVGKFYFNPKHGTDRFYVDAFARFINRHWNYDDGSSFADFTSTRFGIGFGIGYKVVSNKGFVFDIGLGFGRALVTNNNYKDSTGTEQNIDWGNGIFLGKLGVGYRFGNKDRS